VKRVILGRSAAPWRCCSSRRPHLRRNPLVDASSLETASFAPGLGATARAFNYSFHGDLSGCKSSEAARAGDRKRVRR